MQSLQPEAIGAVVSRAPQHEASRGEIAARNQVIRSPERRSGSNGRKQAAIIGAPSDSFQSRLLPMNVGQTEQTKSNEFRMRHSLNEPQITAKGKVMGVFTAIARNLFVCLSFLFLISLAVPCVLFWLKAKSRRSVTMKKSVIPTISP